jgi:hypothetical protein
VKERKCCDKDILEKRGRTLEREEEKGWRDKKNSERREKEGVKEWTEQFIAFKHINIEGTS